MAHSQSIQANYLSRGPLASAAGILLEYEMPSTTLQLFSFVVSARSLATAAARALDFDSCGFEVVLIFKGTSTCVAVASI